MPLATVTEGGRKSKYKVTGDISMKIGWCQGSKEEQAAAVAARVPVSKELKDYEEKEEELKGGEASEVDASDAAALEEERRKEAIMRRVPRGDYQLQVHVIEARDLVGRDYSGISDPAVFVRCFGQSARTQGKDGQTSPVWDETLFISAKDLDEDKLNASQIEVAVYDLDTFSRSDLVGQYTFDVLHVYYGKDHQIWRQWVALSAPHAARDKFLGEDAHGGIQGYLKLSVTLLGPGDKPVIRPDDDEDEEGQEGGVILMPPTLKREVVFLRVGVHKAWQLPKMDKNLLGQKTGIDAYVTLRFAGYEARTAVVTSENPAWFSEFWVPVLVPSVGQKIRISVCDRDSHPLFDKYEEVDVLLLSFDDVLKGQAPKLGWYHLYGMSDLAQEEAEEGTFSKVLSLDAGEPGRQVRANLRSFSSEWRGKLLLGLEIARPDPPLREKLLTRPLVPLQPAAEHRLIPEALYELRVAVLAGSDLGGLLKADEIAGCYVEAVVQEHRYRTGPDPQHPSPPTGDIDYASWLLGPDAAEGAVAPGVLQTISQERQLHLPKDPKQLPAVLVYLCSFSSDHQRVGFLRFEPAALLAKGFAFAPAWHVLAPTSAADDGKPMPALLLSVSFGLASGAAAAQPWPPPRSKMPLRAPLCGYELRLHLFQGRGLPAKDSSGVLDAFVTAHHACISNIFGDGGLCRGKDKYSQGSAVSPPTANPVWYETLLGQAWLPPLELAPEVVVTCWDYDDGPANNISKKDFVGVTRLSLRNALHAPGDGGSQPLPPPQWVQLQARGAHKGSGELLLKLELLPLDGGLLLTHADARRPPLPPSPEPLPNLQPSTRPMLLELAVVGLRGVRTSENLDITTLVMGPRRPFVEVDAGSRPAKRSGAGHSWRTSASNTPSAQNPTYLEVLALPLDLPTNRLFLPALNVRVRDSLFGGLRTPLLGVSAVSLTERLPNDWKDHEERPWQSPNEVTVETWENQRWVPVVDWSKPLLPLDPPPFSTWHGPPFFALPFSAFELPTQEWEWQTEWAIDFTTNPDDAEGFGYAFDFTDVNSRPNALGTKSGHDFVRRRRWFRTYVRTAAPVLAALEVQPSATQSGLSEEADSERAAKKQRAAEGGEAEEAGQKRLRGISTRGGVTRGVLQLANGATPMLSTRSGNNGRGEDGSKEVGEKEYDESEGEWLEEKLLHELEKLETEVRSLRQQLAKIKAEEVGATLSERASLQRQKAKVEKALTKAQAELREREKEFDAAVELPRYMRADEDGGEPERQTKMQELEGLLGDVPFEHFAIESGQGESRVEVAKLKAVVQLKSMGANGALNPHDNEAAADEAAAAPAAEQYPTDPIAALREPREYVVRLYVLRGWNLVPMDVFSTSDPYLRVSLAGTTLDRRKQYLKNVTTAHFYQTFELRTRLPGDALLRIECLDRDSFGQLSDDLIGTTEIDLEDRVFSPRWRNMFAAKPPVEWRSLYSKMSKNPQGVLELWVDILTPEQAEAKLPWDIAPPPPQSWELRVVCWKVKDLPRQGRDYSGLADLYVRAVLTDQKEKRTDTHFRAPKGRACWNWRFKWAVELDSFLKYQRLEVQLWDKDIGFNDHIGVATIPLDTWFTRVYRRKHMRPIYLAVEPPCQPAKGGFDFESMAEAAELVLSDRQALLDEADEELEAAKFWLPLSNQKREEMGWLMLSVELVPAAEIEGRPAGHGRSEPNSNPFLPKPTGRLRFTFNPFVMLYRLLGPKICRQLSGCICLILYLAILFYMIPTLMGHLVWAPVEAAFG